MLDYEQTLIARIIAHHTNQATSSGVDQYTYVHSYKSLDWPPATDAQLARAEDRLGFPLPDFLLQVYHEIANGGFGPGYGLIGVSGGAPHADGWYRDIVDGYQQIFMSDYNFEFDTAIRAPSLHPTYIPLYQIPAAHMPGVRFTLPDHEWPEYLLPFCYWGCNTEHAIHAMSGEVFLRIDGHTFAQWVPSLAVWFERWLAGTLQQE